MNQTLLQNSFHLDYPSNSDNDFIGQDRAFAGSSPYPPENVGEHHSSAASLEQPLVHHPDALPVTNGLHYPATHPVVHDVPSFQTAHGLLVSPIDSSGESVSTSPGSAASSFAFSSLTNVFPGNVSSTEGYPPTPVLGYSQTTNYPQWNAAMSDYRPRVPALQPPLSSSQPQSTSHSTAPSLLGGPGRDIYAPSTHHAPRIPFSAHPSILDSSRPTYAPHRAIENSIGSLSSQNTIYPHQNNAMMMDAPARHENSGPGAPPFDDTRILQPLYSSSRQQFLPDIHAKIHKGFFQVDQKWTCYRRNYFSVSCSFSLGPTQGNTPLYLQRSSNQLEAIQTFSVTISAVVNGGEEIRNLIQHTPKRSKETEEPPKKIKILPVQHSHLGFNSNSTSASMPFSFSGMPQSNGIKQDYDSSYSPGNPGSQNQTSHTFERIQFQRATANNGKRRAQQQYYHVVVELYADVSRPVGPPESVKIAAKLSAPMVVRGRSPGHYKDGRRDSSTSGMGGDGSGGSGGDGGGGSILPPPMSGPGSITRYSLTSDQGNNHMGRGDYRSGDYRSMAGMSFTPLVTSPIHSSSSSGLEQDGLEDEDSDPMDTSEVDKYIPNEYPTASEVDLHSSATTGNRYHIQLPAVDFSRHPVDNFNEASTSFNNVPSFSSNAQSIRHQTPRPLEHYSRTEYGHSSDRNSHVPWLSNGFHRSPIVAGSATWNGNPYPRFEAVHSA